MVSYKINDLKTFVSHLLTTSLFDDFLMIETSITTGNTYHIDGKIQSGFYSEDEWEEKHLSNNVYDYWSDFRQLCFDLIKGRKLPLHFKIVLALSNEQLKQFVAESDSGLREENIEGLYINIQYSNYTLSCITGISLSFFSLDKTLEKEWDNWFQKFLLTNQINSDID